MTKFLLFIFLFLYILPCLCHCGEVDEDVSRFEEIAYRGRYTREAPFKEAYEIVVPRKVSASGQFVSHQIPHHFKRSFYKGRRREDMTPDDALHYRVPIDGEEHHLELYPNHQLLGPGAVVEERVLDPGQSATDEGFLNSVKLRRLRDTECHYHGGVRDHPENSALSACYGLAGYIRTKRSWYMIEPLADHDFTKNVEHPHIIYKKSPNEFKTEAETLCNVTDKLARSLGERAVHLRKRNLPKTGLKFYTVELLVVLDKRLLDYHRDFDVENYVLTLFNMAAGLFHDVSLGIEMELAIVRIIRLEVEEDEMNISVNKDAESTLKFFQEWQQKMNPGDDSHPNHHDCAILITKVDICTTQTLCGFTGMSTIAGTCDPLKGAVVMKDNGLRSGYHIAHHIGHTLGMSHDVEEDNGCAGIIVHQNGYIETSVMYPGNLYVTKSWSKCSQSYLKLYILAGMATCLLDEAQDHQFSSIDMLPGVLYNGDDQCRLRYRQDIRQCDLGITCETLKCTVPGKGCILDKMPPAEGTPCGEKKWCYQMKCLMIGERPGVVDAGWSPWSPWSRCSRTCGSGVAFSERKCDDPPPSQGGEFCSGSRKRHKICATDPCEIGAPSFRDVQCAEFDDWIFPEDGKIHQWVGYNLPENLKASENPCVLFCLSETKLLTSLKPKVVDGTTCYRGIRDICIGGICKEIPCDLDMESEAIEDMCGVCKGDSTSCILKEGTVSMEEQPRLKKLVDVPIGAKNIRVEEAEPTTSRIVVRSKSTKNVLIDGNRLGMFDVPGSKAWLGMIRAKQEALNIPGPITEDLIILVYPKENVTVKYSLGLKQEIPRKPQFDWDFIEWSKCDAPCGPGEQISRPRCIEKIGGEVDDEFCKSIPKPEGKTRPCNQAPCVPRYVRFRHLSKDKVDNSDNLTRVVQVLSNKLKWMIGDWQDCTPCTSSCKKARAVKCIRPVGHGEQEADVIADGYCQGPKPKDTEVCKCRGRRNSVDGIYDDNWKRKENERQSLADIVSAEGKFGENKCEVSKNNGEDEYDSKKMALTDEDVEDDNVKNLVSAEKKADDDVISKRDDLGNEEETRWQKVSIKGGAGNTKRSASARRIVNVEHGNRSKSPRMMTKSGHSAKIIKRENNGNASVEESFNMHKIKKGQVEFDKEDIKNLTLTIILERDEDNNIVNFPKDFKPRPPENGTDFTLVGMDAVRYIQKIQNEDRTTPEVPSP